MTDRPFVGGADTAVDPTPGYYPDPSIPGFVRYWGGAAWVPGTSRPAPEPGEVLEPPRFAARQAVPPAARHVPPPTPSPAPASTPAPTPASVAAMGSAVVAAVGETGPLFFDQTSGGASFVLAPEAEQVLEQRTPTSGPGPAPASVAAVGSAVVAAVGETGPLFFDQTSGGASFVLAPEAEQEPERRTRATAEPTVTLSAPEPATGPVAPSEPLSQSRPEAEPEPDGVSGAPSEPLPRSRSAEAGEHRAGDSAGRGAAEAAKSGDAPRRVSWDAVPAWSKPDEAPAPAPVPAPAAASPAVPAHRPQPALPVLTAPRETGARRPTERPARQAGPARQTSPARPVERPRPAVPVGLGRRLAARLFDSAVIALVAVAAGVPLLSSAMAHVHDRLQHAQLVARATHRAVDVWLLDAVVLGKAGVLLALLVLAGLLYEVLPTARTGQTPGKRLLGVRVVRAAGPAGPPALGRSLLRWVVSQLCVLTVVGLLPPLLDPAARRGWQDRAARTRVVRS